MVNRQPFGVDPPAARQPASAFEPSLPLDRPGDGRDERHFRPVGQGPELLPVKRGAARIVRAGIEVRNYQDSHPPTPLRTRADLSALVPSLAAAYCVCNHVWNINTCHKW